MLYEDLTRKIIGACFDVSNELGCGFLESVYQEALKVIFQERGIAFLSQHPIAVEYHGKTVGNFFADFLIEDKVILEIKALNDLINVHKAQVINYLKATDIEVGLLVNFGTPHIQYHRLDKQDILLSQEEDTLIQSLVPRRMSK
jgi:GxxExxY protein